MIVKFASRREEKERSRKGGEGASLRIDRIHTHTHIYRERGLKLHDRDCLFDGGVKAAKARECKETREGRGN